MSTSQDEHEYFTANPPPSELDQHKAAAQAFINRHKAEGRRLVLVTSGGTTVPLEKQVVRFIDNFSAGTRGATSAEYFVQEGYAVIFLHRKFSLKPFSRRFPVDEGSILDFLSESPDGVLEIKHGVKEKLLETFQQYNNAKHEGRILYLSFTTIGDYLHELRAIALLMQPLGSSGLFYLAAAPSDFFIPASRISEHKIQSTTGANSDEGVHSENDASSPFSLQSNCLILNLEPVPKFLKALVELWAPGCMIVSFKLETDPSILLDKAHYSLNRYQHNLVIGNLLSTRQWEVVFVSPGAEDRWIRVPRTESQDQSNTRSLSKEGHAYKAGQEIESLIVAEVKLMHTQQMEQIRAEV